MELNAQFRWLTSLACIMVVGLTAIRFGLSENHPAVVPLLGSLIVVAISLVMHINGVVPHVPSQSVLLVMGGAGLVLFFLSDEAGWHQLIGPAVAAVAVVLCVIVTRQDRRRKKAAEGRRPDWSVPYTLFANEAINTSFTCHIPGEGMIQQSLGLFPNVLPDSGLFTLQVIRDDQSESIQAWICFSGVTDESAPRMNIPWHYPEDENPYLLEVLGVAVVILGVESKREGRRITSLRLRTTLTVPGQGVIDG